MSTMFSILLAVVITIPGIAAMRRLTKLWALERPNFQGKLIPVGFGFMLVITALPIYFVQMALGERMREPLLFASVVAGFGGLGLVDDVYGSRAAGGFRGHLGELRRGRVTTGLLKMVGGGLLALTVGGVTSSFDPVQTVLNGLLISLSANTLNLLDLRPGRAVCCFWACAAALILGKLGRLSVWSSLLPVMIPAIWLTTQDRRARVMLGDAGSNALGAVLGTAFALELSSVAKVCVLVCMVGIHAYAEKYSISSLIERNRVLRSIDRWLGER